MIIGKQSLFKIHTHYEHVVVDPEKTDIKIYFSCKNCLKWFTVMIRQSQGCTWIKHYPVAIPTKRFVEYDGLQFDKTEEINDLIWLSQEG